MFRLVTFVALIASCVDSNAVQCSGGEVCAHGTVCHVVTVAGAPTTMCLDPKLVTACDGLGDQAACQAGSGSAECHDGACFPVVCGDGLVDKGEACDDDNNADRDGCSANCLSDEVCGNGYLDSSKGEQCDDNNLASFDSCSSDCKIETPSWTAAVPTPRNIAPIAYDTDRNRVVMFGGQSAVFYQDIFSQTAEWDGVRWHIEQREPSPNLRYAHAMVFDAAHHVTVLFDGYGGSRDTWTYDGLIWTQRFPAHVPPHRSDASMAYDAKHKNVVLYGGITDTDTLADTWIWDGSDWSEKMPATSPPARADGAMAYDEQRGVIVLYGGSVGPYGANIPAADHWEWDGTTWTERSAAATPGVRAGAALAYDPSSHGLLLFGGSNNVGAAQNDTWLWNGTAWASQTVPSGSKPMPSNFPMSATDPVGGVVVLYEPEGGIYTWRSGQWTSLRPFGPSARVEEALAFDPLRREVVMFGGTGPDPELSGQTLGETWTFTGAWHSQTATGPTARYGAAMTYDMARREVVMFGGYGATTYDETWRWRVDQWIPTTLSTKPSPRLHAALAYDAAHGKAVLFGGLNGSTPLGDTWTWDGTAWHLETPSSSPPERFGAAMEYDPITQKILLFGGASGTDNVASEELGDTWQWDGQSWTQATPQDRPTGRHLARLAWDAARRALVLVGGRELGIFPTLDAWEWDGTGWRLVPIVPRRADWGEVVPDPAGAGVIQFGGSLVVGQSAVVPTDPVALRWTAQTTYETCVVPDSDGDKLTGCADPDCWWACTPQCPPGSPMSCMSGTSSCGDGMCVGPGEDCALCPADCGSCPDTCGDFACTGTETAGTCPVDCN